jgi:hypothetical protein
MAHECLKTAEELKLIREKKEEEQLMADVFKGATLEEIPDDQE